MTPQVENSKDQTSTAKSTIESSTEAAVVQSIRAFSIVSKEINGLLREINEAVSILKNRRHQQQITKTEPNGQQDPIDLFIGSAQKSRKEIRVLLRRQKDALKTFNIVLFGRTGVGKSTLIEALTSGTGATVSMGESDWTTEVKVNDWKYCRIYDTPGINGWGRTQSRTDLETKARAAVEVADFVIICFDSQNQQAEEFKKISEWVQVYRKPVIAVFQPRNEKWRIPRKVSSIESRSDLSRSVKQHQTNIQDELSSIGLHGVPIVAMSSKRAFYSRASTPIEHPDKKALEKQRDQFGTELLLEWSNYGAFDQLLSEAISSHAVELKLATMFNQLHGIMKELSLGLKNSKIEANTLSESLEITLIEKLLRVFGYPKEADAKRNTFIRKEDGIDILSQLEELRGGSFQAPTEGEYHEFLYQRLNTEIATLRSKALFDGEEMVTSAFDLRKEITGKTLHKKCFQVAKMEKTAINVLEEANEYLRRSTRLAIRDTSSDLRAITKTFEDIDGRNGKWWKMSSLTLKAGGVLTGLAATLVTIGVANWWNPVGWGTAAAAAIATLLGILGRKARKKAESNRLTARSKALKAVRENIYEVYDAFTDKVITEGEKHCLRISKDILIEPIETAINYQVIQKKAGDLIEYLNSQMAKLPDMSDPQDIVCEAVKRIELTRFPNDPKSADKLWLGEDWIDDPDGLKDQVKNKENIRTKAYDLKILQRLFGGVKNFFSAMPDSILDRKIEKWLSCLLEKAKEDQEAFAVLSELKVLRDKKNPSVYLMGDYNTGKSSFIKRLLIDEGQCIPPDLKVRANPTTNKVRHYIWNDVSLVDNPGFQSSNADHTEEALRSFPDAALIVFMFQANLVTGNDYFLRLVMNGNLYLGVVPKKHRIVFIINRSDEFGIDPEGDPEQFYNLVDRKKQELLLALHSREINASKDSIFCIASDPFALVGDRLDVNSKDFDQYRSWDGVKHFIGSFNKTKQNILRRGKTEALLEGGIARLRALSRRQEACKVDFDSKIAASRRLISQISDSMAEGKRILTTRENMLEAITEDHAYSLRDEILAEAKVGDLKNKINAFSKWWEDEAFAAEIRQWVKETNKVAEKWHQKTSDLIDRRLNSPEFNEAFPPYDGAAPDIGDLDSSPKWFRESFSSVKNIFSSTSRDVVYAVGKGLGYKFAPWGALKMAKMLGKAGAILGVIGVTWDLTDLFLTERRMKRIEVAKAEMSDFLKNSVPKYVSAIADGDEEIEGTLSTLSLIIEELGRRKIHLCENSDLLSKSLEKAELKINMYNEHINAALQILGQDRVENES